MIRRVLFLTCLTSALFAQKNLSGTAEIKKSLDKLNTLGSVLMIAAHPDDENTSLITYFARGRNLRTGYLALTRGEGGQNLIGSEQGDKIGIIRTQELLAARRVDGGEQFFSRMIDFGFSKNAQETIGNWGRDEVLRDIVWTIRKFQPDVILLRFSGTPRDGHGHHQTSALLGKEAFALAADPTKYADQLKFVQPWQAKRLYFNLFNFMPGMDAENEKVPDTLVVDTGDFDPVLGYSYNEIAGMSRSQHRSQGMGSPERKGSSRNHLLLIAGDKASKDMFDGVEMTWARVPGGAAIGTLLDRARREFKAEDPSTIVPVLLEARGLLASKTDAWSKLKLKELDETIGLAAGLWIDASAEKPEVVPGTTVKVTVSAIVRSKVPVTLKSSKFATAKLESNKVSSLIYDWAIPQDQPLSQPYWLREAKDWPRYRIPKPELLGQPQNAADEIVEIDAEVAGKPIHLTRPVHNRYVDRADGELVRPVVVVPAVAAELSQRVLLFPTATPRTIEVTLTGKIAKASGDVVLRTPTGWKAEPASVPFTLGDANEQLTVKFTLTPAAGAQRGELKAIARVGGRELANGIDVIRYPHIPPQTLFPPSTAEVTPLDVKILSKKVGYVMGAGDEVPDSLRQLGCEVTLLSTDDIARGDLAKYDAIVTGVRAYNTRPELRANQQRLMQFVEQGGTMIVQYNVADNRFWSGNQSLGSKLGPYSIETGGGRVTDENAAVEAMVDSPLLKSPNAITSDDWKGWVQERGLYFASKWDPKYQALFRMKDPGEAPQDGSTLVANYGKGTYIFSTLAWFRQLPAGVPGAYRIFANFLSASKVAR
ncbi:MAG: PIG-L family deacetylase [Acidobacteria bacterium]|nr:PIG-L family deacetylase [Acidobacteriota bacterium]